MLLSPAFHSVAHYKVNRMAAITEGQVLVRGWRLKLAFLSFIGHHCFQDSSCAILLDPIHWSCGRALEFLGWITMRQHHYNSLLAFQYQLIRNNSHPSMIVQGPKLQAEQSILKAGSVTIFTLFTHLFLQVRSAQTLVQIMTWRYLILSYLILSFHTSKSHHQDEESR